MINLRAYNDHLRSIAETINGLAYRVRQLEAAEIPVSGSVGPHSILSATHTDSTPQVVSRGSLIYGNATPAWDELNLAGIAGSVITRNATDTLWSGYGLAGTAAQTYTFPGVTANIPGGAGAANQVAYWTGVDALTGDAGLLVDAGNNLFVVADAGGIGNAIGTARLHFDSSGGTDYAYFSGCMVGIGTATPGTPLDVIGYTRTSGSFIGIDDTTSLVEVGMLTSAGVPNGAYISLRGADYVPLARYGLAAIVSDITNADPGAGQIRLTQWDGGAFNPRLTVIKNGNIGVGTVDPDRLFHTEIVDAVTAAITYATRTSHTTTGVAAELFGIGHEDELEDAAGNMRTVSEIVTLWATPTGAAPSPLFRVTTYPSGVAGPGYSGHWTWLAAGTNARTMIPDGVGDAIRGMAGKAVVYSDDGADIQTTDFSLEPGNNIEVYNDGADIVQLQMAANGSVTAQRTAGVAAHTFKITVWGTWLYA